jgi:hypothetical protein
MKERAHDPAAIQKTTSFTDLLPTMSSREKAKSGGASAMDVH